MKKLSESASPLKTLTLVGALEAASFILLLGVAMPLKYLMGMPEAVKFLGMAHGLLFILYLMVLMHTAEKQSLPLWAMPLGTLAAVLPFGPLVFDYALKKSVRV
jgi:integral membrane protein